MRFKNNLIVLEGIDGSGKHTQTVLLAERLRNKGLPLKTLSFPCYGMGHCKPVEMYLNGEFGSSGHNTGPYPASVFYAVDRYGSFQMDWKQNYEAGDIVLTDRYTTSNMTCQSGKLSGQDRLDYLDWVEDFEYRIMGLPKPALVIYLDVTAEISHRAMADRAKLDIHESDLEFMRGFRNSGLAVAHMNDWEVLNCCDGDNMRDMYDINDELFLIVEEHLRKNVIF